MPKLTFRGAKIRYLDLRYNSDSARSHSRVYVTTDFSDIVARDMKWNPMSFIEELPAETQKTIGDYIKQHGGRAKWLELAGVTFSKLKGTIAASNPFSEEWLAQRNRDVLGIVVRDTKAVSAVVGSMLESEIEAECTKLLEEDGWRSLRTDPVSDRSRGKGFGEAGMADHLYIRYPFRMEPDHAMAKINAALFSQRQRAISSSVMWIEFKRPGEKAKKHQQDWHAKERARGALTLIAGEDFPATVEGFKAWYADSGLKKLRA